MYIVLAAGAIIYGCLMLAWRRPPWRSWIPKVSRARLREAGLLIALLALALCVIALATQTNSNSWPAVVAVPATGLLLACAPPAARKLMPVGLVVLGLVGLVLARSYSAWAAGPGPGAGTLDPRSEAWRYALLLQSCAFLGAGLWLSWRRARGPVLASREPGRPPRWGLLLPLAAATACVLMDKQVAHPPWVAAVAVTAAGLLVLVLVPAVAADLAATGLIVLGLLSFLDVIAPPRAPAAAVAVAPGGPAIPILGPVDRPLVLVAAVQCAAVLALGAWLVPRTIGVHAKVLLGREDAELAGRVEQLTQTRADAVDTAAAELRRVERDLHDGAQARLVALGMNLRTAERLIPTSPQAAIALVAEARETSARALTELRNLVRGVYPPVLADRGLADAVRALALDAPVRTETDIDLPGRPEPPVESACYFAVAEALANAVKHSGARLVQIRMRYSPALRSARLPAAGPAAGALRIEVTDDGAGGADPARGTGLQGVERRLGTFDGILAVSSPPGGPTMIIMEVPCALLSPRTSSC
jgi:signal transduction histidine kinase